MKTITKIAMIVLMSVGSWMSPQKVSAQIPGITFQTFYDQLSPYGAWVNDAQYGYVWVPDEAPGFFPYGTNGHWVFTDYGWTWVSDYPWGWAPFHYGRWNYDSYYGWLWIPGTEWAPAWVTWRRSNDYFGWAPLGPGVTLRASFARGFYLPEDRWMFVRGRDFDRPDLDRHFVGRREYPDLIRNSTSIAHMRYDNGRRVGYLTGPDRREFTNITGRNIRPIPINDNNQAGRTTIGRDHIQMYKPPVTHATTSANRPSPDRIVTRENIKPISNRSQGDLIKASQNVNQRPPNRQATPPTRQITPQNNRSGQVNQNNRNNQVTPRPQGQTNNRTNQVTPRPQGQNNQIHTGGPVQRNNVNEQKQQLHPQGNVTPTNNRVNQNHNTGSAPARNEKKEGPPHSR